MRALTGVQSACRYHHTQSLPLMMARTLVPLCLHNPGRQIKPKSRLTSVATSSRNRSADMPGELTAKPRWHTKTYEAFPCSFAGCSEAFPSAYELRVHKHIDPQHQFCLEDDFEAKDHDDMKRHRAQSEIHNACPNCGDQKLKTVEGLRLHIMKHKAQKETKCFGCDIEYHTAEALWGHLDRERAPVVCRGPMNGTTARASDFVLLEY